MSAVDCQFARCRERGAAIAFSQATPSNRLLSSSRPPSRSLFLAIRCVHALQRHDGLVLRIKLLIVRQDKVDQSLTVDEAQIATAARKVPSRSRECAERDEERLFLPVDFAIELRDLGITRTALPALHLNLDDRWIETQLVPVRDDVDTSVRP